MSTVTAWVVAGRREVVGWREEVIGGRVEGGGREDRIVCRSTVSTCRQEEVRTGKERRVLDTGHRRVKAVPESGVSLVSTPGVLVQ